jgi:hypothetical protein
VTVAKILETFMLVCFGFAWPMSLVRSWRSRTAKGKSLGFLFAVLAGYASGCVKVILTDGWTGFLLIPYIINFLMVACDLVLYFRNRRLDLVRAATGSENFR